MTFNDLLQGVCLRPAMYVGARDFRLVAAFLNGYSCALYDVRADPKEALCGFREWLAVRLNSCVKSAWDEIIVREHPGEDHFEALIRLYAEFSGDRSEGRLAEILERFKGLGWRRDRTCWCELPLAERDQWKPGSRRR
jgi:hypothetical protein